MIGQKMLDEINKQINEELYSSYLYLSMGAWFKSEGWNGMAQWMMAQAKEEDVHAMKFFHHIVERGGKVELKAIAQPKTSWGSPLEVFRESLKHEQHITSRINGLYKLAMEESDYPAQIMLQWFIEEQVEEEASVEEVIQAMEKIGDHVAGLFMLDHQLGQRK